MICPQCNGTRLIPQHAQWSPIRAPWANNQGHWLISSDNTSGNEMVRCPTCSERVQYRTIFDNITPQTYPPWPYDNQSED